MVQTRVRQQDLDRVAAVQRRPVEGPQEATYTLEPPADVLSRVAQHEQRRAPTERLGAPDLDLQLAGETVMPQQRQRRLPGLSDGVHRGDDGTEEQLRAGIEPLALHRSTVDTRSVGGAQVLHPHGAGFQCHRRMLGGQAGVAHDHVGRGEASHHEPSPRLERDRLHTVTVVDQQGDPLPLMLLGQSVPYPLQRLLGQSRCPPHALLPVGSHTRIRLSHRQSNHDSGIINSDVWRVPAPGCKESPDDAGFLRDNSPPRRMFSSDSS
jgi:hypothetical protein